MQTVLLLIREILNSFRNNQKKVIISIIKDTCRTTEQPIRPKNIICIHYNV